MGDFDTDICVIGGGPAGIAAALEAAKSGVHVTLIDERPELGGQIYRRFPNEFQVNESELDKKYLDREYQEAKSLIKEVENYKGKIEKIVEAKVWGIFPNKEVVFILNEKNIKLKCRKLILSEGAYERPAPFPGWTLPGVYTAGGAQSLLKTQRVLPGKKFLLSGTGPLQLVLANQLVKVGAEVVAVLEASSQLNFKHLAALGRNIPLMKEGLDYLKNLRNAKVPFLKGHTIVEALGSDELEAAVYAKVDRDWKPIPGTEKEVEIDTVCLGYGFVSSTWLTQYCGCEHKYNDTLGCWVPVCDEKMETSVRGVYAAGDCAGVTGHLAALEEGRIAGISVSRELEAISQEEANKRYRPLVKKLMRVRKFQSAMNQISKIRPGLYSRLTDDTIICRCEEVTLGKVKEMLRYEGNIDLNAVKRMTRTGMGNCQGRMCMTAIADVIAIEKQVPQKDLGFVTYRPPAMPIPLKSF